MYQCNPTSTDRQCHAKINASRNAIVDVLQAASRALETFESVEEAGECMEVMVAELAKLASSGSAAPAGPLQAIIKFITRLVPQLSDATVGLAMPWIYCIGLIHGCILS